MEHHEAPHPPQFALRAAVANYCNMACVYCPQPSQEDLTPPRFRGRGLGHDGYLAILEALLSAVAFEKVSFTGGEPLLNHRLHEIVAAARNFVPRVELNTNAVLLTRERWRPIAPHLDQLKISIDTVDRAEFQRITRFSGPDGLDRVLQAISLVQHSGVEVVLNGVVMRRNLEGIFKLIEFVTEHRLRLHLLDFNYTEECREVWEREFVPAEDLMHTLVRRFGASIQVPRFGCGYFEYYPADGAVVRVRTSFSGSMRSGRCLVCPRYCQTGLFGLRLSTDGWVTYCFSTDESDGVLLEPGMTPAEIRQVLAGMLSDIATAVHTPDSFQQMVSRLDLSPQYAAAPPLPAPCRNIDR